VTEQEKKQTSSEEKKASTPATTEAKPTSKPAAEKKSANSLLAVIALLVAILALAASAYLWQNGQTQNRQLLTDLGGAQQLAESQQGQVQALQRELAEQTAQAKQQQQVLQENLKTVQDQLRSQQQRLISLSTTDREDWLLAEVEYLTRLAEQRVLTAGDAVSAIGLLEAADKILHELDDSALYPVRKTLAENKTALQVAAKLDIDGLYLRLDALASEVGELQLFSKTELTIAEPESKPVTDDWRDSLEQGANAAWDKLSQYIQIHRRDDVYKPALAPEHEEALRQNVRLMFEQAQMALLSSNEALYQRSLNKAQQWLKDFYTLEAEAAAVIADNVEALKQQQITAELPDISSTRRALKAYIETLHELPQEKDAVAGEQEVAQ
jgi:uroporphyrin-3 C-methyltransferase